MLKINVKDKKSQFVEVKFDDIYVSPDLTYFTFVCDSSYDFNNDDYIWFVDSEMNRTPLSITVENFTAFGEVSVATTYQVYDYDQSVNEKYIVYKDGKRYYNKAIFNNDTYNRDESIHIADSIYPISNNLVSIDDKYYITEDDLITHDGREYHTNIYLTYDNNGNVHYNVSYIPIIENEATPTFPTQIYDIPKKLTRVKVNTLSDRALDIETVVPFKDVERIIYAGKYYDVVKAYDSENDEFTRTVQNIDGGYSGTSQFDNDNSESLIQINDEQNTLAIIETTQFMTDLGDSCWIYTNAETLDEGDIILAKSKDFAERYELLLKNDVSGISSGATDMYIYHKNIECFEQTLVQYKDNTYHPYDFLLIGEEEYEIHYLDKQNVSGYVIYNDEKQYFLFEDLTNPTASTLFTDVPLLRNDVSITNLFTQYKRYETDDFKYYEGYFDMTYNNRGIRVFATLTDNAGTKFRVAHRPLADMTVNLTYRNGLSAKAVNQPIYGVRRYTFLEIDGQKFKVYPTERVTNIEGQELLKGYFKYTILNIPEEHRLIVSLIDGSDRFVCIPFYGDSDDESFILFYSDWYGKEWNFRTSVCYDIYTNFDSFEFYKENKTFGDEKNYINETLFFGEDKAVVSMDKIHIYKDISYFELPISLEQDNANNILQQDILENEFFNIENENAINRIVDMEKDLYYPAYQNGDVNDCTNTKEFSGISKIVFNMHFRTRDLDNWKINEDENQQAISSGESANNLMNVSGISGSNWFCIDYYSGITSTDKIKEACKHSDLLAFLNFTNDDIFYQKSKVGKSFLRLLFYDSKNPSKQKLLYSATVWLDENLLYKKYINNMEYNSYDPSKISNYYYNVIANAKKGEGISVDSEPCFSSNTATFSPNFYEDARLDAQFVIKNRYQTSNSAEGFYLHLFKELSDGLHEKKIYMKVQFNHAGEGKIINFMLPINQNGNLITNFNQNEIEYLCQGSTIVDLYDKVYIEIRVKYDPVMDRYVWYLPKRLVDENGYNDGTMTFNLFEVKLKDESFIET